MQKKLIALAIAGLSGAAFAQSNVTIYGAMDATYDNVKATSATSTAGAANRPSRGRVTMNSAFIGFKGAEDLGGGLKAVWQVETAINENQGAGGVGASTAQSAAGFGTRDTFLGLNGGWGTLVAGVLSGPTRVVGCKMDVNNSCTGIGANTALLGKFGGGNGAGAFDQRLNNAIAYISPTWSGFHFAVGYLPNESRTTEPAAGAADSTVPNTSGWTLGGIYDQGPLFAALTWTQLKDKNATDTASTMLVAGTAGAGVPGGPLVTTDLSKVANTRAAVKYSFGAATVGFMWDRSTATLSGGATVGGASVRQSVYYVPVTFKVGNGTIIAQYGQAKNVTGSIMDTGRAGNGNDYGAKHWQLGYEHSLSKRTIAKVMWSQITNKEDATYDFLYGVSAPNTTTTTGTAPSGVAAGADPKGLSIGLRHSF